MTDKQPEALRLADGLEQGFQTGSISAQLDQAAAELRRLHEVNAELLEVLQEIRDNYDCDEDAHKYGSRCRSCVARAAITNATGEQR
jgi:hypothetical protein